MASLRSWFTATVFGAALLTPLAASATVFTFDDNNPGAVSYNPLPTSYHGLTWTNWATIDGATYGASGYANGVVSSPSVACGCAADFGLTTDVISSSSNFTLNSGYFTSAWNDGETLLVQGLSGATVVDTMSVTINTEGPLLVNFGWSGIDSLQFTPSGGTNVGLPGAGEYFALDNLSLTTVPEPATWAMMLVGFGGLGAAMRSRRKQALAAA